MNPFKSIYNKLPNFLQNKYRLVLFVFIVWMAFFDKNDFYTQWKLQSVINKLETDKAYYLQQIDDIKKDKSDLEANKEKYAREHFYMHKSDEDVFIMEE
ncbi:MAG: septum formation initiator family protein [Saprospiraceae bacterium]|nr:septum formation initiator family protein [Saprospiraceae bacterium]